MGAIQLDASRFPLVRITLPRRPTEPDIAAVYAEYDVFLARGRHVLLVDLRELDPLFGQATARRATMHEIERRNAVFERTLVAEARVVSGTIVRGIVTAFEWMRRRPRTFPLEVVEDESFALEWLLARMAADGTAARGGPPSRR